MILARLLWVLPVFAMTGYLAIAGGDIGSGDATSSRFSSSPDTSAESIEMGLPRCRPPPDGGGPRPNLVVHTRLRILPAMPAQPPSERPHGASLAIVLIIADQIQSDKAVFFQTDTAGACALTLPPGRYWIGPADLVDIRRGILDRPSKNAGPFVTESKTVFVGADPQQIVLYTIGALP